MLSFFFFFNDTATTEIYTLSLHDALPILEEASRIMKDIERENDLTRRLSTPSQDEVGQLCHTFNSLVEKLREIIDRKSTRLNSSHANISYAVFCLKKKK